MIAIRAPVKELPFCFFVAFQGYMLRKVKATLSPNAMDVFAILSLHPSTKFRFARAIGPDDNERVDARFKFFGTVVLARQIVDVLFRTKHQHAPARS